MLRVFFMARETRSSVSALQYILSCTDVEVAAAVVKGEVLLRLCKDNGVLAVQEGDLRSIAKERPVDYIFSFYWKRIKGDVLALPKKGAVNFHPGPLPEARGSGYHAAILEKWGYWGVTAHYMDEEFDTGRVIRCERFGIPEGILNRDLVKMAHERLAVLFRETADEIRTGGELNAWAQQGGRYYSLKEVEASKKIDAGDDSEAINRKIHAFWNPPYSGAQIELGGSTYTVIDDKVLSWTAKHTDNKEDLVDRTGGGATLVRYAPRGYLPTIRKKILLPSAWRISCGGAGRAA